MRQPIHATRGSTGYATFDGRPEIPKACDCLSRVGLCVQYRPVRCTAAKLGLRRSDGGMCWGHRNRGFFNGGRASASRVCVRRAFMLASSVLTSLVLRRLRLDPDFATVRSDGRKSGDRKRRDLGSEARRCRRCPNGAYRADGHNQCRHRGSSRPRFAGSEDRIAQCNADRSRHGAGICQFHDSRIGREYDDPVHGARRRRIRRRHLSWHVGGCRARYDRHREHRNSARTARPALWTQHHRRRRIDQHTPAGRCVRRERPLQLRNRTSGNGGL